MAPRCVNAAVVLGPRSSSQAASMAPGAEDPADHLGGNVAGNLVCGEPLAEHEAHGDGGVDMAA